MVHGFPPWDRPGKFPTLSLSFPICKWAKVAPLSGEWGSPVLHTFPRASGPPFCTPHLLPQRSIAESAQGARDPAPSGEYRWRKPRCAQGHFPPIGGSRVQQVDAWVATSRGELKSQGFVGPPPSCVPHPRAAGGRLSWKNQSPPLVGGNSSSQGVPCVGG